MSELKKEIVKDFLSKCNVYATMKLKDYTAEDQETQSSSKKRELHEKRNQWQTYIQFNEHAIKEINTGKLDSWF